MTTMIEIERPAPTPTLAPAKKRILDTADVLFYDEGIRAVGVDRLIAASNVTKATFYKHYGSKDNVIAAYIGYRHRRIAETVAARVESHETAVGSLYATRDAILESIAAPD